MLTRSTVLVLTLALASLSSQARPATLPVATAKPDATAKRCLAAQRRVERQHEVLEEQRARVARDAQARERCETRRACERLDRAMNAHEARRARLDRQLAQFELDGKKVCGGRDASVVSQ